MFYIQLSNQSIVLVDERYFQTYKHFLFSSSYVWVGELDYKEN